MRIRETPFYERLPHPFKPASTAQRAALDCPAEILNFGGAAGSLKSQTVIVDALKYHQQPTYRGLIVRKTYPEIKFLIDRTRDLYSQTSGTYYEADRTWKWPWGASIDFRYLDRDADVHKHQGWEYQFFGVDESTHQTEFQIRYIINSRMRSTAGIPLRVRLATNPGNVSHKMHKSIFHGPKCTHCILRDAARAGTEPKWLPESRKPFVIYHDAVWPSDKVPIQMSTCFIPGRVTDHSLFGALGGDYAKKLHGMSKALQEALLEGCWEAFDGQYFDCFDPTVHVISRADIHEKDWWPYWVGCDYGFGHATFAYLFTMSPDRIVYTLSEYGPMHRRKATDVMRDIVKIWGSYPIKAFYMSPDLFRHDGTEDLSRAEQMSQATGTFLDQAYNDRISGWSLMYDMLDSRRWFITSSCEVLPSALQSRKHAEKDAEDIEKTTDDDDDAADGARYGIASYINPGDIPIEMKIRDLQEKEWSKDPTVAMIQYQMYMAKQSNGNLPIRYDTGRTLRGSR